MSRMQKPSARILDIGSGVGAISIGYCRSFANLHVVGLEPQDAPLALARRNILAAGLADRIELRKQGIEDLTDEAAFDLAFYPQSFMPEEVFRHGVRNVFKSLRPGGWIEVAVSCTPGTDLRSAISRLRDMLTGGNARFSSQVEAALRESGFTQVSTLTSSGMISAGIVVGQRHD